MRESEDEDDQPEPYQLILPQRLESPGRSPVQALLDDCKQLSESILKARLSEVATNILNTCFSADIWTQDEQSKLKHAGGFIYSAEFSTNQQEHLPAFLKLLENNLKHKIKSPLKSPNGIQICKIDTAEVKEIVCEIYSTIRGSQDNTLYIFLMTRMTDLNTKNLYCFKRALFGLRYIAILSTLSFVEMSGYENGRVKGCELMQFPIYNSKLLFCKFLYSCLLTPNISVCFPKEVFSLVTDFDFYPIPYKEAVRRFMFCVENFSLLNGSPRPFCDLSLIIDSIEAVNKKVLYSYDEGTNKSQNMLNILRVIFNDQTYRIPEKAFYTQVKFQLSYDEQLSKDGVLVKQMRRILIQKLSRHAEVAECIKILETEPNLQPKEKRRNRNERSDQFGITKKCKLSDKETLELQITAIILKITEDIRDHASSVAWNKLHFEEIIRPELPRLIFQGAEQNEQARNLLELIRSYRFIPLSVLAREYTGDNLGRLMYILTCLEANGIIQINRKGAKPLISTNYFDKANFSQKKQ